MTFFLFFHLYSQSNTFVFSIFNFIINNVKSLLLSTYTDSNYLLQNINAENILEIKKYEIKNQTTISINKNNPSTYNHISIGAWVPLNNSLILQQLKGEVQKNAIKTLLNQGFHEYYFAMNNFEDTESTKLTEELLKSAEQTNLKIIIILRPPSEGNSDQVMIGKVG